MTREKLKNKTLLIITNGYPCEEWENNHNFVKAQVDEIKNYFKNVYVLSQNPFFPQIIAKLPFIPSLFRNYSKTKNYCYDNVSVFFVRYFTFPEGIFNLFRGNSLFSAVHRCIKKNNLQFDLIHAHFTWPSGYVAVKLKEKYGKKVIVHSRENKGWLDNLIKNKLTNYTWRNTDVLVRVNNKDIQLLKRYNNNTTTIYNGVNTKKFKIIKNPNMLKKKYGLPKNKKIILNIGSLRNKHKNQMTLLKSIYELRKQRNDFFVILVGDGEDKNKFIKYIRNNKLENFTKIIPNINHDDMPKIINCAHVFVFTSFFEGNPNVFFETQACGVPYVGTDVGDVVNILKSEKYILHNKMDHIELAKLINKSINSSFKKEIIRRNILDYDVRVTTKKLVEQMYNLIAQR